MNYRPISTGEEIKQPWLAFEEQTEMDKEIPTKLETELDLITELEKILTSDELLQLSTITLKELEIAPLPIQVAIPEFAIREKPAEPTLDVHSRIISLLKSLTEKKDEKGKSLTKYFNTASTKKGLSLGRLQTNQYMALTDFFRDFDQMLEQRYQSSPDDYKVLTSGLKLRKELYLELPKVFPEEINVIKRWKNKKTALDMAETHSPKLHNLRKREKKTEDNFFYYENDSDEEINNQNKKKRKGSKRDSDYGRVGKKAR